MRIAVLLAPFALLAGCQTSSLFDVGPQEPTATFETLAWPPAQAGRAPVVGGHEFTAASLDDVILAPTRDGTEPRRAQYRGRFRGDTCVARKTAVNLAIGKVSNAGAVVTHARRTEDDDAPPAPEENDWRFTERGLDNGPLAEGRPYVLVALRPDGNLDYAWTVKPEEGVCYGVLERVS